MQTEKYEAIDFTNGTTVKIRHDNPGDDNMINEKGILPYMCKNFSEYFSVEIFAEKEARETQTNSVRHIDVVKVFESMKLFYAGELTIFLTRAEEVFTMDDLVQTEGHHGSIRIIKHLRENGATEENLKGFRAEGSIYPYNKIEWYEDNDGYTDSKTTLSNILNDENNILFPRENEQANVIIFNTLMPERFNLVPVPDTLYSRRGYQNHTIEMKVRNPTIEQIDMGASEFAAFIEYIKENREGICEAKKYILSDLKRNNFFGSFETKPLTENERMEAMSRYNNIVKGLSALGDIPVYQGYP